MVNNTKNIYSASVYIIGGESVCNSFFEAEQCFIDRKEAIKYIKEEQGMSENQKIALMAYMYLYSKVNNFDSKNLDTLQVSLGLSNAVIDNIKAIITTERIEYIADFYKEYNDELDKLLKEPDDLIVSLIETVVAEPIREPKLILRNLKSEDYEHSLDRAAFKALKETPGIDKVFDIIKGFNIEKPEMTRQIGSSFKVTENNIPDVYKAVKYACEILDVRSIPQIYIADIGLNAQTMGGNSHILVLGSACLSLCTYDELLYIIGHELGHIKSEHYLYQKVVRTVTLLLSNNMVKMAVSSNPIVGTLISLVSSAILLALLEWDRKSELTADRAGLLVCQNPDAVYTAMTKIMGFPMKYYDKISKDYILEQASEFGETDTGNKNLLSTILNLGSTHPWMVSRAKEIERWVNGGNYNMILNKTEAKTERIGSANKPGMLNINFK